jgi:perosamine synthetase
LAMAQMNRLGKMLDLRKRNADSLTDLVSSFANHNGVILPHESQNKRPNWYLYTITFTKDNVRDAVQKKMVQRDKVGATVYYDPPVHRTPYYERMLASKTNSSMLPRSDLGNTDWASKHVLSLPIHPLVTQQELERIAHSLKGAL